jgi:lactoylglutathione lyase
MVIAMGLKMNFCWVTLQVKDMEESIKFYSEIIGLTVSERFLMGQDTEIAMLGEKEGTKVELICSKNNPMHNGGISIGFETESLEEAMKLVRNNNIPIKRGPISPTPALRFFFLEDPNGVEVQIVEHVQL